VEGSFSLGELLELLRVIAVIAVVVVAAALATPKGRLPLALRGVAKILRRDGTCRTSGTGRTEAVPGWKRLLAFALVLLAVLLAVI